MADSDRTHEPPRSAPEVIFDVHIFDEVLEISGTDAAVEWLQDLQRRLETTASIGELNLVPNNELQALAHALVTRAGFLGFSELSARCATLEEACRADIDVRQALEEAKRSAERARPVCSRLLAPPEPRGG